MCQGTRGCDGASHCYSRNDPVILDVETRQVRYNMGSKMVNGVPMSVVYTGMSIERWHKLSALYDRATDIVADRLAEEGTSIWSIDNDQWDVLVRAEFQKLCIRAAKKAEWNNKPNNKVSKIIRTRKQKVNVK